MANGVSMRTGHHLLDISHQPLAISRDRRPRWGEHSKDRQTKTKMTDECKGEEGRTRQIESVWRERLEDDASISVVRHLRIRLPSPSFIHRSRHGRSPDRREPTVASILDATDL